MLDPDTGNWTVKLKVLKGLMDDWSVSWVKVHTDAPNYTFKCNFTTMLDMGIWEAARKTKQEVVATCSRNGTSMLIQ